MPLVRHGQHFSRQKPGGDSTTYVAEVKPPSPCVRTSCVGTQVPDLRCIVTQPLRQMVRTWCRRTPE
jgi:hypothetical protein